MHIASTEAHREDNVDHGHADATANQILRFIWASHRDSKFLEYLFKNATKLFSILEMKSV